LPTLKNFYRSPFSKWPPQYRTNSTLSDFTAISYVGRLWCPEMIPDVEKFLPVFQRRRSLKFQPIRAYYWLWQPYWISDWNEKQ
jgi:hypothetical protein